MCIGCTGREKFAGTFGNVGSFSFHPRKAVTSGEGGMLVTDDEALARKLKILKKPWHRNSKWQNGICGSRFQLQAYRFSGGSCK